MSEPERASALTAVIERLRTPQAQLALLGGLLGIVMLAIFLTDLATGGDTEPPPALGRSIAVTPGTRIPFVPTLAPIERPTPQAFVTPTPSDEAAALARDADRLKDMDALQDALAEYYDRFGEFPDTGGGIQTLCAYTELDKGCDLKEVLDESEEDILEDPQGETLVNGYWYSSDGETYTIWMLREGPGKPGDPVCPEVVEHLKEKGSLFCVTAGAPQ